MLCCVSINKYYAFLLVTCNLFANACTIKQGDSDSEVIICFVQKAGLRVVDSYNRFGICDIRLVE